MQRILPRSKMEWIHDVINIDQWAARAKKDHSKSNVFVTLVKSLERGTLVLNQ